MEKTRKPSPRGHSLDEMLDNELKKMLDEGFKTSPITIPALTKRLNLKSRSTLHTTIRKEKILRIRSEQRALGNVSNDSQTRRKELESKVEQLKNENLNLQNSLDTQLELICRIVANATAKGWDVNYLLKPLDKNRRELI